MENNYRHAFTPNIREVTKFYNLGDQILETDFCAYEIERTGISTKLAGFGFQMVERRQNVEHQILKDDVLLLCW